MAGGPGKHKHFKDRQEFFRPKKDPRCQKSGIAAQALEAKDNPSKSLRE
jgi:hypothetical protein